MAEGLRQLGIVGGGRVASALAASLADLRGGLLPLLARVEAVHHHLGAEVSEPLGQHLAQAVSGSGHQGDLASEGARGEER